MSCFTICDGNDCTNNENNSGMYNIPFEVQTVLKNNGYNRDINDLCEDCLKDMCDDDDINTIIGITEYDGVVLMADDGEATPLINAKDKL